MNVDIDFKDEKLNKIIKAVIENYNRFNTCSMTVKTNDWTEFETDSKDYNHDIDDYDRKVIIKLKFFY